MYPKEFRERILADGVIEVSLFYVGLGEVPIGYAKNERQVERLEGIVGE